MPSPIFGTTPGIQKLDLYRPPLKRRIALREAPAREADEEIQAPPRPVHPLRPPLASGTQSAPAPGGPSHGGGSRPGGLHSAGGLSSGAAGSMPGSPPARPSSLGRPAPSSAPHIPRFQRAPASPRPSGIQFPASQPPAGQPSLGQPSQAAAARPSPCFYAYGPASRTPPTGPRQPLPPNLMERSGAGGEARAPKLRG